MAHSNLHELEALAMLSLSEFDINMSSRILCTVSGGADSTALAKVLSVLCATGQFRSLGILHINHSLRGAESDADEEFVRQFAETIGADFFASRVDTKSLSEEKKQSIEEAARTLRYAEFTHVAAKNNYDIVATAHTANDNLETVIHNMVRGTGIFGLRGIPPKRQLNEEIEVIRPFLDIERADLLRYLEEKKLSYREDSSNITHEFLRNRIRHLVVPAMEQAFEGRNIYDGFRRTIRIVSEFTDRQDESTNVLVKHTEMKMPPAYFPRDVLAYDAFIMYPMDQTILRSFVMMAVRRKWKDYAAFSLDSTQTLLLTGFVRDETKQEYWISDDLVMRRERISGKLHWAFEDEMKVGRILRDAEERDQEDENEDEDEEKYIFPEAEEYDDDDDDNDDTSFAREEEEMDLIVFERLMPRAPFPDTIFPMGSVIETSVGALACEIVPKSKVSFEAGNAYFDWDVLRHTPLMVRQWKEGDRIYPFGMKGNSKLVSDLLNEANVPSYHKKQCVVCVFKDEPDHLVWLPGLRAAEIAIVTPETETVLVLTRIIEEK